MGPLRPRIIGAGTGYGNENNPGVTRVRSYCTMPLMPGDKPWVDPQHSSNNQIDWKSAPWAFAGVGDSRREYDEYGNEIGDWFSQLAPWQWFVTLTLGNSKIARGFDRPGLGTARACLRELLTMSRAKSVLCVFELHKSGVPHLHALLAGCTAINGGIASEHFFNAYGISRWKIYREGGGAAKYVGKYLAKEMIELYIGLNGPWEMDDFKILMGGYTKKGTPRFIWDTQMAGLRV